MIHEFAVEPATLNNWDRIQGFIDHFGFHKGRVISKFPKDWKNRVFDSCKDCKVIEKKRIEERMNNINDRLVRSNRVYDGTSPRTWYQNALEQHSQKPFHRIIAETNVENHKDVILYSDHTTSDGWNIPPGVVINRNAVEIANSAKSLLQHSKKLYLIDPHFDPSEDRYREPLNEIFKIISRFEQKYEPIEIHCTNERIKENWQESCNKILEILPDSFQVTICRWRSKKDGDRPHARYILTERGGIHVDYGLDMGPNNNTTTDVQLLSKEIYVQRIKDYITNPIFEKQENTIIIRNPIQTTDS